MRGSFLLHQEQRDQELPWWSVAETLCSQCRGVDLIPGQGTRSHMPQLRVHMLQLNVPHATINTQCSQINKKNKYEKRAMGPGDKHGESRWQPTIKARRWGNSETTRKCQQSLRRVCKPVRRREKLQVSEIPLALCLEHSRCSINLCWMNECGEN